MEQTRLKSFLVRGLRMPSAAKKKPGIGVSAIDMCHLDVEVSIAKSSVHLDGAEAGIMNRRLPRPARALNNSANCSTAARSSALFVNGLHQRHNVRVLPRTCAAQQAEGVGQQRAVRRHSSPFGFLGKTRLRPGKLLEPLGIRPKAVVSRRSTTHIGPAGGQH